MWSTVVFLSLMKMKLFKEDATTTNLQHTTVANTIIFIVVNAIVVVTVTANMQMLFYMPYELQLTLYAWKS